MREESDMKLRTDIELPEEKIVALYDAVGWSSYTNEPANLMKAISNASYVVTAWNGDTLIGLARCLSDDVSIFYLQDILVHPEHQRAGVGRALLTNCIERFEHVRQRVLITDDEEKQRQFYESLGYVNTKEFSKWPINCFIHFKGMMD